MVYGCSAYFPIRKSGSKMNECFIQFCLFFTMMSINLLCKCCMNAQHIQATDLYMLMLNICLYCSKE